MEGSFHPFKYISFVWARVSLFTWGCQKNGDAKGPSRALSYGTSLTKTNLNILKKKK